MLSAEARTALADFLDAWGQATPRGRRELRRRLPLEHLREAALRHPDPFLRRRCIAILDHEDADGSAAVFLAALDDPVAVVREMALHGLACEQCRTADLCVSDVTERITRVLHSDPSPDVRYKALPILLRLADRNSRALAAIRQASEEDTDDLVRDAAAQLVAGRRPRRKNQFRRHIKHRSRNTD